MIRLEAPISREDARALRAGDEVAICGVIYTARDAAHARLCRALDAGEPLPIPLEGTVIYYAGPTPTPPGRVIGSVGPTTSYRMDAYAPRLLGMGLRGMIGKGARSAQVIEAMRGLGAVYLGAIGGAGALLAGSVRGCTPVAYADLGAEAIYRLEVEDFPAIVVIDSNGESLYESGPAAYLEAHGKRNP